MKYFTKSGLEMKLKQLRLQEEVVKATGREIGEEAGVNCDWHDNFGYEDAMRRFQLESSILSGLREDVSGAQVISVEEQSETVKIGSTAKVAFDGHERLFTIGGYGESDPPSGLISYTSPLGRALLGMKPGDSKRAAIGNKAVVLELLCIFPPSYRYHELLLRLAGNQSTMRQETPK